MELLPGFLTTVQLFRADATCTRPLLRTSGMIVRFSRPFSFSSNECFLPSGADSLNVYKSMVSDKLRFDLPLDWHKFPMNLN